MVRENRVKQNIYSLTTPTSGTNLDRVYSTPLNGEFLSVEHKTNSNGSIFITDSGTDIVLWSNIAPSGANYNINYPIIYAVDSTNTTGSPTAYVRQELHNSIAVGGSGFEGGSIPHFILRYR